QSSIPGRSNRARDPRPERIPARSRLVKDTASGRIGVPRPIRADAATTQVKFADRNRLKAGAPCTGGQQSDVANHETYWEGEQPVGDDRGTGRQQYFGDGLTVVSNRCRVREELHHLLMWKYQQYHHRTNHNHTHLYDKPIKAWLTHL